jgi:hypothetical protein
MQHAQVRQGEEPRHWQFEGLPLQTTLEQSGHQGTGATGQNVATKPLQHTFISSGQAQMPWCWQGRDKEKTTRARPLTQQAKLARALLACLRRGGEVTVLLHKLSACTNSCCLDCCRLCILAANTAAAAAAVIVPLHTDVLRLLTMQKVSEPPPAASSCGSPANVHPTMPLCCSKLSQPCWSRTAVQ